MKRIFFLLLAMCSFASSYSQNYLVVKDYLTAEERDYSEKDLDNAFAAPVSKFVGKKWYSAWKNTNVIYFIFNNDKTGAIVTEWTDNDYTYPVRVYKKSTFRWKRNGNDMTITRTPHLDIASPIESSMTQLSPRVKAEVKKDYANVQRKMREVTYSDNYASYRILKISNEIFNLGDFILVSKKKLDEISARKDKEDEERAAKEKEEQAAREREREEQAAREAERKRAEAETPGAGKRA